MNAPDSGSIDPDLGNWPVMHRLASSQSEAIDDQFFDWEGLKSRPEAPGAIQDSLAPFVRERTVIGTTTRLDSQD